MVFFNKKKAARKKIYNARFSVKGFLILKNTSFADLTASVKQLHQNRLGSTVSIFLGSHTCQLSNVHVSASNQTFSTTL